jgi:hypothetical protein
MATAATIQPRIVSGGGPITNDVHRAFYSAGTSASEDWARGEILTLRLGFIYRIGTFDTAGQLDTDDAGFSSALRHFIALTDHDSSAFGATSYVAVQEITNDTVLEFQLANSAGNDADIDQLNTVLASREAMAIYKSAAASGATPGNVWGVDTEDATTKGVIVIEQKGSDYQWMRQSTSTTGVNAKVYGRLIQSVQL